MSTPIEVRYQMTTHNDSLEINIQWSFPQNQQQ